MTLTETSRTVQFTCPECGWTGAFDARFAPWCMANDHGLISPDEQKKLDAEKKRARRKREAGRRRGEALEQRLARAESLKPGGAARFTALAFAVAIHGLTLAVLAGSVALLFTGVWVSWIAALLGFGVVWLLRPRLGSRPKEGWARREDLPELFAILDRVGGAIGVATPRYVRFDSSFNAGTARLGLRHERVLVLGAPLWQVLSADERLALLGHELGHQANGDSTQGVLVRTARRSLREWRVLFYPSVGPRRVVVGGPAGLAQLLVPVVLFPIYAMTTGLEMLYAWIQVHVSLRAEFLADEISARTASTDAALRLIKMLDTELVVESYITRTKSGARKARRKATSEEAVALWGGLREYLATVPEHEFTRQHRVSEFRGTRSDASHPAHYLRSRLLKERSAHAEAAVSISAEEWEKADRELSPYLVAIGRRLLS